MIDASLEVENFFVDFLEKSSFVLEQVEDHVGVFALLDLLEHLDNVDLEVVELEEDVVALGPVKAAYEGQVSHFPEELGPLLFHFGSGAVQLEEPHWFGNFLLKNLDVFLGHFEGVVQTEVSLVALQDSGHDHSVYAQPNLFSDLLVVSGSRRGHLGVLTLEILALEESIHAGSTSGL